GRSAPPPSRDVPSTMQLIGGFHEPSPNSDRQTHAAEFIPARSRGRLSVCAALDHRLFYLRHRPHVGVGLPWLYPLGSGRRSDVDRVAQLHAALSRRSLPAI